MQKRALKWRQEGRRVGVVPTMGFLHEGHLSLMRLARSRCEVLVVTLFVNPSQFNSKEDLATYPHDFERDEAGCREAGVDLIFSPSPEDMYAPDASVWVDEEQLSAGLCGASRPGHFRGVCTVVAKLFHITLPHLAVFGEKDAQQLRIIERMVRDLNFPVEIIRAPIVREPDGLAMSSRNHHLSESERRSALCLQDAIRVVEKRVEAGERSVEKLHEEASRVIAPVSAAKIDYIAFVDDESLEPVEILEKPVLMALAVWIGKTRLIDNAILQP
jgi:pantoate--beta-alanine ligase